MLSDTQSKLAALKVLFSVYLQLRKPEECTQQDVSKHTCVKLWWSRSQKQEICHHAVIIHPTLMSGLTANVDHDHAQYQLMQKVLTCSGIFRPLDTFMTRFAPDPQQCGR